MSVLGNIIIKLISLGDDSLKFNIAIDRTNWKFGKSNINFIKACVIFKKISIPIAWMLLDKKGNSNTDERILLLKEILKILPKEKINAIMADREFIGDKWFNYLKINNVSFCIRLKAE